MADADAWNALAWSHLQSGRNELGLEAARRAHEASRSNPDYLNTLGVAYAENGELELAEATFRKLLKRRPGSADARVNLAKSLEKLGRLGEALTLFERALAIEPSRPGLAANLARLHREHDGQAAHAAQILERHARHVAPEELALGLSACDLELAGPDAAAARLGGALRAHPDWRLARHALAHLLLGAGRYAEGWKAYAARGPAAHAGALPAAGELLLLGEQGLGDVLFFLRFMPLLRARGVQPRLACEPRLQAILENIATVEPRPGQRGILLGDLPALLECADTPAAWPLAAGEAGRAQARARLASLGPAPYLAVTWRAGTDVARAGELGAERTSLSKAIDPALLGAALRGRRGTVLLLQRGERPGERERFAGAFGAPAPDLTPVSDDLTQLLALLAELDEYVGVSNTNMHLLAGLGRSARVLVPYPAEWRWMHAPGRSPWFPAFATYRQAQSRDWTAALRPLAEDLAHV